MRQRKRSQQTGHFEILANARPGLAAGRFKIELRHELQNVPKESFPAVSQRFDVRAPRFSLPPGAVAAVYPPDESSGAFSQTLPHVVLGSRTLPWQRILGLGAQDHVPWLALLVLTGSEAAACTTSTVEQLLADEPDVLKPALSEVSADERKQPCQVLRLDAAVFKAVVPWSHELPFLAHVRRVDRTGQQPSSAAAQEEAHSWCSLLVANRFPSAGLEGGSALHVVHLVSLEGFLPYLNRDAVLPKKSVALISLAQWSFRCLPERGETFRDLVEALAAPGKVAAERLLLRLPAESGGDVGHRLAAGFVPLAWRTATGEDTFAWYRGPLTPMRLPYFGKDGTFFASASAAMVYDKANGLFDHSLAAAWQIGRSLALADSQLSAGLLALRRKGGQLLSRLSFRLARARAAGGARISNARVRALLEEGASVPALATEVNDLVRGLAELADPLRSAPARGRPPEPAVVPLGVGGCVALPQVRKVLAEALDEPLRPVVDRLSDLILLAGVPFEHLVPDARMLPPESLRFFHVDPNWLQALVDGALSVGRRGGTDRELDRALRAAVWARAMGRALQRKTLQGPPVITGFLLRSALVSGWPALTIQASAAKQPLPLLRLERLAPAVLLCLFRGVPDSVEISEPGQALHFGSDPQSRIILRSLAQKELGRPLGPQAELTIGDGLMRSKTERVLEIGESGSGLTGELAKALRKHGQLQAGEPLSPADFALQMIDSPAILAIRRTE